MLEILDKINFIYTTYFLLVLQWIIPVISYELYIDSTFEKFVEL